jgi:hypothetical protein
MAAHYNNRGYDAEVPMFTLKIRMIGASAGTLLPDEMLQRLGAKLEQNVYAIETPTGYTITTLAPQRAKASRRGRSFH